MNCEPQDDELEISEPVNYGDQDYEHAASLFVDEVEMMLEVYYTGESYCWAFTLACGREQSHGEGFATQSRAIRNALNGVITD